MLSRGSGGIRMLAWNGRHTICENQSIQLRQVIIDRQRVEMPLTQNNPLHSFRVILGTHKYQNHPSCVLHTGNEYSNNILLSLVCYTLGINILIIFSVTWNVSTGSVLVEFMGIYKFTAEEMARLFLSRSTPASHIKFGPIRAPWYSTW